MEDVPALGFIARELCSHLFRGCKNAFTADLLDELNDDLFAVQRFLKTKKMRLDINAACLFFE